MDKAQALREAKALMAEWSANMRRTDDAWREIYPAADLAKVEAALDLLENRLAEEAGPSLFFRLTSEQRAAVLAGHPVWASRGSVM